MLLNNVEIKDEDYPKFLEWLQKGVILDGKKLDYLEFYNQLSLVTALNDGTLDHLTILRGYHALSHSRVLKNELPCERWIDGLWYKVYSNDDPFVLSKQTM